MSEEVKDCCPNGGCEECSSNNVAENSAEEVKACGCCACSGKCDAACDACDCDPDCGCDCCHKDHEKRVCSGCHMKTEIVNLAKKVGETIVLSAAATAASMIVVAIARRIAR